jgi:8-oxo-dGTP pyrophosphatase MutT (NUDIX family)
MPKSSCAKFLAWTAYMCRLDGVNRKVYRQGVFGIIIDDRNHALLIQKPGYRSNEWTVVGGGANESEPRRANLLREVREETGLESKDLEIIGGGKVYHKYDYPPEVANELHGGKYKGQNYSIFVLRLKATKRPIIFNKSEISRSEWAPINSLEKYLIFPGQYKAMKRAIDEALHT